MNDRVELRRERRSYLIGLALAAVLTAAAFGAVAWSGWPRTTLLWIIATTAVVQVGVHFRYFLHIDLSKSKRDDLQLILFSFLIVLLMAGGTIWILTNLRARMM
jgi:cytochrome o ubiquinol oxidase operon protein cyoD